MQFTYGADVASVIEMAQQHCLHSGFTGRTAPFRQQQPRIQVCRSSNLTIQCKESRIGKAFVPIPQGVTVTLKGHHITVKVSIWKSASCSVWLLRIGCLGDSVTSQLLLQGPKGTLERTLPDLCDVVQVTLALRLPSQSLHVAGQCILTDVESAGGECTKGGQA